MIITTGLEPDQNTLNHADQLAERFGLRVQKRGDLSLQGLRRRHGEDEILVVSARGARLEIPGKKPFFFHPNTAAFRIKRLVRGDTDTMFAACQIHPGDHILDATMGLGADAIVFAYAAGASGRVVGIESQPLIAILVEDGLQRWTSDAVELCEAMRRVEVRCGNHLELMQDMPDDSFDVVYFDPMFEVTVESSTGIAGIREHANTDSLHEDAIHEALRVAKKRVVIKEGKTSRLHEKFGFTPVRVRGQHVVYSYKEIDGGE